MAVFREIAGPLVRTIEWLAGVCFQGLHTKYLLENAPWPAGIVAPEWGRGVHRLIETRPLRVLPIRVLVPGPLEIWLLALH